ncbi:MULTISPECIES: winged helix-turn-helix domain-containing protein [unclassified Haloferax]|uniref:helix-turn-helix transcriptional regulator n=1 Tax=unclassified Haloferax TaxID=2625095 RepID=UPI0005B20813|nr:MULTISPECIES: hypothetical protein [unclassified Haloferax]
MSDDISGRDVRVTMQKRHDILVALATEPQTKPELVESVGPSRSTVDRAVHALQEIRCVTRCDGDYCLTPVGRIALAEHERYVETMDGIASATDVLNALPNDVRIAPEFLSGADVRVASAHAPESALQPSLSRLDAPGRLVGFAPVVLSLYTDTLTDLVTEHDIDVEIVLRRGTLDSLLEYYRDRFDDAAVAGHFEFHVSDRPVPYALWIKEREESPVAGITVHEHGGVRGVLMNDEPRAVEWARDTYEHYREEARHVTTELQP